MSPKPVQDRADALRAGRCTGGEGIPPGVGRGCRRSLAPVLPVPGPSWGPAEASHVDPQGLPAACLPAHACPGSLPRYPGRGRGYTGAPRRPPAPAHPGPGPHSRDATRLKITLKRTTTRSISPAPAPSTSKPSFVAKDTARCAHRPPDLLAVVKGTRFAPLLRRPQLVPSVVGGSRLTWVVASRRNYIGAAPRPGILCQLCRRSADLTRAHVPPQCAGNTGNGVARMRPYLHDEVMRHDSPKDGGLCLRTICRECNTLASQYDDAYGDFAQRVNQGDRLKALSFALPGHSGGVPAVYVSPGRVARSLLHGMVALAPSLHLVHAELVDKLVRDEAEVRLPPGLQLRVARVRGPACRISSAYSMMQVLGERQVYDVFAEICFPPLIWVLCSCSPPSESLGPSLVDRERWGDATDWIRYSRIALRSDLRDVLDRLPVTVHPTRRDRVNWIEMSSPDHSYLLEGLIRT